MPSVFVKLENALSLPISAIIGNGESYFGNKRIYWIYLISSTLLALFIYVRSKRKEGFHHYIFHKKVWLSRSAFIDYYYIFFNSIVKVFVLAAIINWSKYIAFYTQEFFLNLTSYLSFNPSIFTVSVLFIFVFTLLEDFLSFFIHWLHHKIPFLWQFHKVHHSATVLNPITQYRIHPVELFFNNVSHLLALGLCQGIFSWLFSGYSQQVSLLTNSIFSTLFFIWGANLRHSHIRLSYFSWLENIFISPYQHQIHHSANPVHFNKNLGSKLAIWDYLFGTLIKSKEAKNIRFGLGLENKDFNNFIKTLLNPFFKILKKE